MLPANFGALGTKYLDARIANKAYTRMYLLHPGDIISFNTALDAEIFLIISITPPVGDDMSDFLTYRNRGKCMMVSNRGVLDTFAIDKYNSAYRLNER